MKRIVFLLVAICAMALGCSQPEPLECNYGVMDITPDEPVLLAGFAARKGLSDGVHRPLKTHCLVIRKDTVRVCIISNDMMEMDIAMAGELRRAISEQTGIPYNNIFIHNIHTHSAPRLSGASTEPGGSNVAYRQKFIETLVANAVQTASDNEGFRPFTIEVGRGQSDINCNRCEEGGPIDHDVWVARFVDKKGKPIVSMLNFSCHPVSLNHRSLAVSTDFPGIAVDDLESEWDAPVFYFSGAQGNVDPCGSLRADTTYTQRRGHELSAAALLIKFNALPKSNTLTVRNEEVHLPYRIDHITAEAVNAHVDSLKMQTGVSGTWLGDIEGWRELILRRIADGRVKDYLPVEIAAVNVGGLEMLFSQGEPFNEYQKVVRESMPDTPVLFIAYTNGQNSYLPSAYAYASTNKGYSYEKEQMHVYIKAPYPLSDNMPQVYEGAIKEILK
jgi:hypothetical protein